MTLHQSCSKFDPNAGRPIPMPYDMRRLVASFQMRMENIPVEDVDAGFCLDAPDLIPLSRVIILRTPAMRHDPIITAPGHTLRGK